MATPSKLGIAAVFYFNNGNYASPNYAAESAISDCSVPLEWDQGDASTRASRVKQFLNTMLATSVAFKIRNSNSGDTAYTSLYTSAVSPGTFVNIMVLNGSSNTNGNWGFAYDAQIKKSTEDQGLGAVIFDEMEAFPYASGNAPQVAVVASGAPVFTAI